MPRITKVYTRTGDDGSTGLGAGERVPKDAVRVATYGTVDELNSAIGVARVAELEPRIEAALAGIQNELFHLGAELSMPAAWGSAPSGPRIEPHHVEGLEKLIDELSLELPPLENFVLPGGAAGAAQLHLARAVCRRAERLAVRLAREEGVAPAALAYLNRLSDALFVMARAENRAQGAPDVLWDSRA
jgi:cob(I)alamin adenosyltransferase